MDEQIEPTIRIKGVRDGLLLTLGDGLFADLQAALAAELTRKAGFLAGSGIVLELGKRPLERDQLAELLKLFDQHQLTLRTVLADDPYTRRQAREMGFGIRLSGSQTDLDGNILPGGVQPGNGYGAATLTHNALLLHETLRSGRSVTHDGHVVIMGDVNPGAEVIAGGNVIVWGRLRGLVHAGAMGEKTAVICALELKPTQLRIADQIAIPPADGGQESVPEQASIRDGQIVAEPWKRA